MMILGKISLTATGRPDTQFKSRLFFISFLCSAAPMPNNTEVRNIIEVPGHSSILEVPGHSSILEVPGHSSILEIPGQSSILQLNDASGIDI